MTSKLATADASGGPLMDFAYSTYSEAEQEYPGYQADASGRIEGLRVLFLNRSRIPSTNQIPTTPPPI
jgi:hypothetical protein